MKRIKYYVNHCTVEERDSGKEHHEMFDTKGEAIKRAETLPNDEFVAVEKHHEIYEHHEWRPHWDLGDEWLERIL